MAKRISICQAGLEHPLSEEFAEFGCWLEARRDAHAAALRINRYFLFFQAMDAEWRRIPGYKELLGCFHAEGLCRVRTVMRWMEDTGRLLVDEKAREEDSERCRIQRLEEMIDASTAGGVLWHAYRENLMNRYESAEILLRSVRLTLSAAADMVRRVKGRVPLQSDLDGYLLDKPGRKASITGFVNFVNEMKRTGLVLGSNEPRMRKHAKAVLERQLIALMKNPKDTSVYWKRWAEVAMRYFHGRKLPRDAKLYYSHEDGLWVRCDALEYWLPLPCMAAAARISRRKSN